MARVGRLVVALVVLVGACLGVSALAGASPEGFATKLVAEDPGARLDGNTIVVTGKGDHVLGVPDRPNFIVALGSGETIEGGSKDNELGALGRHDTIIAGKGHELLVAGADDSVIARGSGHDLVVDAHPNTTIHLGSPGDEVMITGHDDHVVCFGDAVHDHIYDNHSDTVSKSCKKKHDSVKPEQQAGLLRDFAAPVPLAHTASVTGDGSDGSPYTALCDDSTQDDCTVSFPSRTLSGFWANEFVPAYKCPSNLPTAGLDHPYLVDHNYAPAGTSLPRGVEIQGLGDIGVSILRTSSVDVYNPRLEPARRHYYTGTLTEASSATNWTLGSPSYRVILHCTDMIAHGYWDPTY